MGSKVITNCHKHSDVVAFKRVENSNGSWCERTCNEKGKQLTYKDSDGYWSEFTYDEDGKELTYKNSNGYWSERTYDEKGGRLTFKSSYGTHQIKGEFVTKEEFEHFLNTKPPTGKRSWLMKLDIYKKLNNCIRKWG